MKERKTNRHKQFTLSEKNQLVLLYLDHHLSYHEITKKYKLSSSATLSRWVGQYREFGTCVDNRGRGTKAEIPNKGRPKKHKIKLEELNKEQLIEKVRLYEDIKKSLVYLIKQQPNSTIR